MSRTEQAFGFIIFPEYGWLIMTIGNDYQVVTRKTNYRLQLWLVI
jgi:hypothetical protein